MPDETTTSSGFVHLHLHSEYSLLDGGNRIDRLVARVKELGMDAVAVTDHGNMHGAVTFYETCRREGIRPILGVEAYVAPGDRTDKTYTGVADGGYHLVLLAENNTGWQNLMQLCSEAYLTGFYFKPRIDRELLRELNSGIIAINGHLGSEMGEHLLDFVNSKDNAAYERAVESARWHAETFADEGTGPRFFVELQSHVPEQDAINPHLIKIARDEGLPLVCDNDSHFLRAEDHDAHDTLICISTGKSKLDTQRMKYTPELYVKSPEQMRDLFGSDRFNNDDVGRAGIEALDNTVRIAERCNVELAIGANHAPVVVVKAPAKKNLPKHSEKRFGGDLTAWYKDFSDKFELEPANDAGLDQDQLKNECDKALRLLCEAGMVWRYGPDILQHKHAGIEGVYDPPAEDGQSDFDLDGWTKWARLNRELKILADKLISAYFLIVWDFTNWGRQRGIPALARGSGVGTMTGYVLGLSNACPVEYGLLFERFTDPDRNEYPDIDIDLCQDGRGEVIDYVRQKYGHVAQIITFGTLKARAAVRDVARVHELPLGDADRLAKLIPEQLGITLDAALKAEPELQKLYDSDEQIKAIIDNARVLEGQARHSSVHAAGVIVATRPLHEVVPLYKQSGSDDVITQWDGPTCEKMGLLKMDFLGLRTLSIIERCKKLITETLPEDAIWNAVGREAGKGVNASNPHPLDLERLTYDDQTVFELFRRGDATGVFQFESGGMRRLLQEMKPDRLADLIAANALYRPGPMDLIPDYNMRKHGVEEVPTVHPIVDKFTAETYGVMVYQEQVMQIVHELGGIPLRQAYALIKAISKKKAKIIDANRPVFVESAQEKGLSKSQADGLFELILKFAGYGFNKSHSTGYAIVAYQTAYLKTYFPSQYMAAFLTFESQAQKVSDWIPYLDECKRAVFVEPTDTQAAIAPIIKTGIEVRPPDVNLSEADFAVVFEDGEQPSPSHGHVRFGLKAIKGVGSNAIEAIISEREGSGGDDDDTIKTHKQPKPYESIFDFCERVLSRGPGALNKATVEALIRAGCFDAVHGRDNRAAMLATVESAMSAGQKAAKDRMSGQGGLFGMGGGDDSVAAPEPDATPLVKATPWSEPETLRQEKETLGFYVSSHPLEQWRQWSDVFTSHTIAQAREQPQDKRVVLVTIVQSVRAIVMKQGKRAGQKMGIVTVEDLTGTMDTVLFADAYARFNHLLEDDEPKFVLGRIDHRRGEPQVIVDALVPIEGVPLRGGKLRLVVAEPRLNGSRDEALQTLAMCLRGDDDNIDANHANGNGNGNGHALSANGSTAVMAAPVASALQPMSKEAAQFVAAESPVVPIQVWVETPDAYVEVEPRLYPELKLCPHAIGPIMHALGPGSARLVGGVAIEMEDPRAKWAKKRS